MGTTVVYTLADVARLTGRALSTVQSKVKELRLEIVEAPSTKRPHEVVQAIKGEDLERLSDKLQQAIRRKTFKGRERREVRKESSREAQASEPVLMETIRTLEALAEKHEALAGKLREAVEWIKA